VPQQSIGVLQRILNDIHASVQAGGALLYPELLLWVTILGTLALAWVAYGIIRNGYALHSALGLLVRITMVLLLLDRWPWFLSGLRDLAISLGLVATGNTLDLAEFLDPGMLVKAGIDSGAVLWRAVQKNMGWTSPFLGLVFTAAWLLYVGAYMVMAYKVFWFQVEMLLASLAGLCVLPLLCFRPTAFVATGLIAYSANMAVRFLITTILAGALWNHLATLTALVRPQTTLTLAAVDFTIQECFYAAAVAVVLAAAFLSINRIAGMLTSGVPGLAGGDNVGSVVRLVTGGVMAMVTGGAGLATAGLGAARLGAAGVQGVLGAARAVDAPGTAASLGEATRQIYAGGRAAMGGGAQAHLGQLMGMTQRLGERSSPMTVEHLMGVGHSGARDQMYRGVGR
jgi:type IV secretion system protein TrbL